MAAINRVPGEPWRELDRPAAGADGGLGHERVQEVGDAPVPGSGPILVVGFHAGVGDAAHLVDDLVSGLVADIAAGDGELCPLLEIDDEGDGDPRFPQPTRVRRLTAVSAKVPSRHCLDVLPDRHGPGPIGKRGARQGRRPESPS